MDTNVLLDMYRLPKSARDELLEVLSTLKDRIWIPYQVALEYQRNRLTVIAAERKTTEDAISDAGEIVDEISKKVLSLQMDKRGLGIDSAKLIEGLKSANTSLIEAINSVHASQLDIAITDPIRDQLDELLAEKIGQPPNDQEALNNLCKDGEDRYSNKIPPGYEDASKDKNPNEATFFHDGIYYQRKFGDLIFWRQIMDYAIENGTKEILLITSERKEDWWWREKGRTIGPRPELAREIKKYSEVDLFWMYSASQFLENARNFTKAVVSDQSVTELEQVSRSNPETSLSDLEETPTQHMRPSRPMEFLTSTQISAPSYGARVEKAVFRWLRDQFDEIGITNSFPDFVVEKLNGKYGYEVKYIRNISGFLFTPPVVNAMMRGYLEVNEKRLSGIGIIVVADKDDIFSIDSDDKYGILCKRADDLIKKYPVDEMIIGYLENSYEFVEFVRRRGNRSYNTSWSLD